MNSTEVQLSNSRNQQLLHSGSGEDLIACKINILSCNRKKKKDGRPPQEIRQGQAVSPWSCIFVLISCLAGTSIDHNVYNPDLTLPPVDPPAPGKSKEWCYGEPEPHRDGYGKISPQGYTYVARFWREAVRHVVYLLNCLPTKALGECNPFEAWIGRKPHFAHLRVFGCVASVKNTTSHLKKLDGRSSPMVYLGVEEGCKTYRVFDSRHDKLQISRDVIFQENCEWIWNAGANKDENLPKFMVVDAFDTDEVIVAADVKAGGETCNTTGNSRSTHAKSVKSIYTTIERPYSYLASSNKHTRVS
ncbi:hypothetical protein ZIOFF_016344 [Zingiber officinale]|uniref:Retroviral polymerase SH3-like domain-containing protein n=1 Tax=Zingiber officinale TaxID=94328 RepID=A0A8J5HJT9_ZINOF|nr:hypothetical protein ZIOFF_016344 [Zingiber officinale]